MVVKESKSKRHKKERCMQELGLPSCSLGTKFFKAPRLLVFIQGQWVKDSRVSRNRNGNYGRSGRPKRSRTRTRVRRGKKQTVFPRVLFSKSYHSLGAPSSHQTQDFPAVARKQQRVFLVPIWSKRAGQAQV